MNKRKFLTIILLSFSLVMLTNGVAFAEHECTHQVVHSDGTTTISTDCSSSFTSTSTNHVPGMYHIPYSLYMQDNNLLNTVNAGTQNFQNQTANSSSAQVNPGQVTAESQQKDHQAIEEQQTQQQEQEDRLENYKQQHST